MAYRGIYLDIGGVLLTNGWDTSMRKKAALQFDFDFQTMNSRHGLMFGAYELGKISLDTYLDFTLFYQDRGFTKEQFIRFMLEQSIPHPEMIDLVKMLKQKFGLKIGLISNEGRELTEYRVKWLKDFADFFCVSCFVQLKKPDPAIFHLAFDLGQIPKNEIIYIDDREPFAQMATALGYHGIYHQNFESTQKELFTLLEYTPLS